MPVNRRIRFRWWAAAGLLPLVTACGVSPTATRSSPSAAVVHLVPKAIVPAPAGTQSASAPEPNGSLWVLAGNAHSKGIFDVDISQKKIIGSVSVSNHIVCLAESSTGILGLGYGTRTTGAIEFANGSTGQVTSTVPLSGPVENLAAGDDGTTFYALNGTKRAKTVTIVDAATGKIVGNVPVPSDAISIVPTPAEHNLFALQPNGVVSEFSVAGGHIETQFPVGHSGRALALSPNGTTLYVLKGQGTLRNVAVVKLSTETVTKTLPAAANTIGIVLSPDGHTLYDIVGTARYGNIQAFHL